MPAAILYAKRLKYSDSFFMLMSLLDAYNKSREAALLLRLIEVKKLS